VTTLAVPTSTAGWLKRKLKVPLVTAPPVAVCNLPVTVPAKREVAHKRSEPSAAAIFQAFRIRMISLSSSGVNSYPDAAACVAVPAADSIDRRDKRGRHDRASRRFHTYESVSRSGVRLRLCQVHTPYHG
jgi:hypothetical protein